MPGFFDQIGNMAPSTAFVRYKAERARSRGALLLREHLMFKKRPGGGIIAFLLRILSKNDSARDRTRNSRIQSEHDDNYITKSSEIKFTKTEVGMTMASFMPNI